MPGVSAPEAVALSLDRLVTARIPGATGIEKLRRLSGGASQETWSFDATSAGDPTGLILRRRPGGMPGSLGSGMAITLEVEAGELRADASHLVRAGVVRVAIADHVHTRVETARLRAALDVTLMSHLRPPYPFRRQAVLHPQREVAVSNSAIGFGPHPESIRRKGWQANVCC